MWLTLASGIESLESERIHLHSTSLSAVWGLTLSSDAALLCFPEGCRLRVKIAASPRGPWVTRIAVGRQKRAEGNLVKEEALTCCGHDILVVLEV